MAHTHTYNAQFNTYLCRLREKDWRRRVKRQKCLDHASNIPNREKFKCSRMRFLSSYWKTPNIDFVCLVSEKKYLKNLPDSLIKSHSLHNSDHSKLRSLCDAIFGIIWIELSWFVTAQAALCYFSFAYHTSCRSIFFSKR